MSHLALRVTVVALAWGVLGACAPAPTPAPPAAARPNPEPASINAPATSSPTPAGALKVDPQADGMVYTFKVVPEESQAGYAVREQFFGRPAPQTTVGTTQVVEGQFTAELRGGKLLLRSSQFKVDLRTLKSDNPIRDQAIQRAWLESNKYPFAEFSSTRIEGLPPELKAERETAFKVIGNLTIRETTKPVTFDAKATLTNGDTLVGSGTTFLLMKDFGFDAPDIAGRLQVTDGVTVTVKGTAKLVAVPQ